MRFVRAMAVVLFAGGCALYAAGAIDKDVDGDTTKGSLGAPIAAIGATVAIATLWIQRRRRR